MYLHFITIFPEIFESFFATSLLKKAQEKAILQVEFINPRQYCEGIHQQIDDKMYGGGAGMLIKAQPIIDSINACIKTHKMEQSDFKILFPSPSTEIFTQKHAYSLSKKEHLIFICGRYEGIDHRVEEYLQERYSQAFQKISLGKFILLGGEIASMTMTEAIARLIPGVIKETESRQEESYSLKENMENLEAPQYTRPEEVYGYRVPEILLTGNEQEIIQRKKEKSKNLTQLAESSSE